MPLIAVENTSLPDQVFAQLAGEILGANYAAGETLPAERTLASVLGVNRHVVREALGRLEQLGLVRIVQGGGTTVLDFRRTAGLDLLGVLAEHAGAVDGLEPLRAALEMRAGIGVDVARLCAERANAGERERLVQTAEELAAAATGPALLALDQRFWQQVLDGARNFAYQLAFNSLIRAVQAIPEVSLPWLEGELHRTDHRRPIAAAIAAGEAARAAELTRLALEPPTDLQSDQVEPVLRSRKAAR